jgi:hypothetical protein
MQSQGQIVFSNLKSNISVAIKETCTNEDEIIYKIVANRAWVNRKALKK